MECLEEVERYIEINKKFGIQYYFSIKSEAVKRCHHCSQVTSETHNSPMLEAYADV